MNLIGYGPAALLEGYRLNMLLGLTMALDSESGAVWIDFPSPGGPVPAHGEWVTYPRASPEPTSRVARALERIAAR